MLSENFKRTFSKLTNLEQIEALSREKLLEFRKVDQWREFEEKIATLPTLSREKCQVSFGDFISLRSSPEEESRLLPVLQPLLTELIPWRKGPWNFFGTEIDTEWRSELKWNRFCDFLGDLEGRRIIDIGCNNGYYLYRMLPQKPAFLLGLDPSIRCYYQFEIARRVLGLESIEYLLFGIDEARLFPSTFDVALCMGVIYHRRDPITSCQYLYECLKPAGRLLFESIIIPGENSVALSPADRYAQMRNVWFVPTVSCMLNWLKRAGFKKCEVIDISPTTPEEQRTTPFSPYQSLSDYLDPADPEKTVEGYPAPQRATVAGYK